MTRFAAPPSKGIGEVLGLPVLPGVTAPVAVAIVVVLPDG